MNICLDGKECLLGTISLSAKDSIRRDMESFRHCGMQVVKGWWWVLKDGYHLIGDECKGAPR